MKKGMAAPIAITVCIVLVCAFFALSAVVLVVLGDVGLGMWIIWLAVMLVTIGISVFVLAERIKEIKSGEEDDLGKY